MNEIIAILNTLSPYLTATTLKQLILVVEAALSMTGRITMLGLSRWTEKGGSYRTIQRLFSTPIDWPVLRWHLIKPLVIKVQGVWILAGDEVVVTKSGKKTHGLGRFFSSIYNKPLPGLCFLNLSLVSVKTGTAYPLIVQQQIRDAVQVTPKAVKKSAKKPGRPKGSVNKNRSSVALSPFQTQLQHCISAALALIGESLNLVYFVYDGALGNNAGLQAVKQTGLHLICKLRYDSRLYLPYTGEYSGRGPRRKYGKELTPETLTDAHLRTTTVEQDIETRIYQAQVWHKKFSELLNVVIIVKMNLKTGKTAKILLFSDDLTLTSDLIINYYSLRFQIEFNFRDAKQHWGLEDFMNIKETQVGNAANFSLFMVTFSHRLSSQIAGVNPGSMLDLKTLFRARKYLRRIINSLGKKAEEFLITDDMLQAAELGRIHAKAA
jgi:hypothetical protein